MAGQKQSRIWGFTLNNYTEDEVAAIKSMDMEGVLYMCYQTEVAPETGTPHLQGMFSFPGRGRRFNGVKNLPGMERAHLDAKSKGAWVNRSYCTKADSRALENYEFFEMGECPLPQGARNDIKAVKKIIDETCSMRAVLEQATSVQAIKVAEACLKVARPPLRPDICVRWFWGPTGSGKSRTAYEEAGEDAWTSNADGKWWDGYDGEQNIILDDYRRDFCKFHEFLRILDRYRHRVAIKGGMRPLRAVNIWITAPKPPAEMWGGRTEEDLAQLLRRIHEVREFTTVTNDAFAAKIDHVDSLGESSVAAHFVAEPLPEPEVRGNTRDPDFPWDGNTTTVADFQEDEEKSSGIDVLNIHGKTYRDGTVTKRVLYLRDQILQWEKDAAAYESERVALDRLGE